MSYPDCEIYNKYPVDLEKRVKKAIEERRIADPEGAEKPFYIIDLVPLVTRFLAWMKALPRVQPFYAVKCNPNPVLLKTLRSMGAGFDCASSDEINKVQALGATNEDIIFANPCKMSIQIQHAKKVGVVRMTFDNEDELVKIAKYYPEAEMVLRIATDDSHSQCRFSTKFGALMSDVPRILETAAKLKVKVVGVSYHVGSGCGNAQSHAAAATDALNVFAMGEKLGFKMNLLDIGGGFLGEDNPSPSVADVAGYLNPVLDKFPAGTRFIAEPGRYFATACHTLVTCIHSRRVIKDAEGKPTNVLYYINDGIYGGFNCIYFDHKHPLPFTLLLDDLKSRPIAPSTLFGPTCDSIDCICKDVKMPLVDIGDWLFFVDMGAYTSCAATHFNGFDNAVDYIYMYGDKVLTPASFETVDSVKKMLSELNPDTKSL